MRLEIGPVSVPENMSSGGCWKDKRHVVSMNTGRVSELSAEFAVTCKGKLVFWSSRCPIHRK